MKLTPIKMPGPPPTVEELIAMGNQLCDRLSAGQQLPEEAVEAIKDKYEEYVRHWNETPKRLWELINPDVPFED